MSKSKRDEYLPEDVEEEEDDFEISDEEVVHKPSKKRERVHSKSLQPKQPTKKQKLANYEFQSDDVEIIEKAIQRFGLNYSSIWETYYKQKTSLNRLRNFINCLPLLLWRKREETAIDIYAMAFDVQRDLVTVWLLVFGRRSILRFGGLRRAFLR